MQITAISKEFLLDNLEECLENTKYYPYTKSNDWYQPDDPAEIEGNVNLSNLTKLKLAPVIKIFDTGYTDAYAIIDAYEPLGACPQEIIDKAFDILAA